MTQTPAVISVPEYDYYLWDEPMRTTHAARVRVDHLPSTNAKARHRVFCGDAFPGGIWGMGHVRINLTYYIYISPRKFL
jgi:hypothetical protein